MPPIWCEGCGNLFSDLQYFTQHLNGNNREECNKAFFDPRKKTAKGLSQPIHRASPNKGVAASKRRKTIRDVEATLAASDAAAKRREARQKADYSVFDYRDLNDEGTNVDECTDNPVDIGTDAATTNTQNVEAEARDNVDKTATEAKVASNGTPDTTRMRQFKEYVARARKDHKKLKPEILAAVELMDLLNKKGGSVALFDAVFAWHVDHLLSEKTVTANSLHTCLVERYNLEDTMPFEVPTKLPHAGVTANLTCHDVLAQTACLLTEPRLDKSDFLFFNNDPRAFPPEEFETVGDINTGRAYRAAHKALIAPSPLTKDGRLKILNPYMCYLDACTTGQFMNLSIELLKFTLGIFKFKVREQGWAWRNVGCVTQIVKGESKAKEFTQEAAHVDAAKYLADPSFREFAAPRSAKDTPNFDGSRYENEDDDDQSGDENTTKLPSCVAQDLHSQLQVMLSSYKIIDDNGGIEWDLAHGDEVIPVLLVPFIMFIKADGKEADKMCGQFQSKQGNVKCLCRYCICPTKQSDESYRTHPLKSQKIIEELIRKKETAKLKQWSQQDFWNAWYDFTWGLHNELGVHGGCPMEILHWLQLGQFKYSRTNLFQQTGPTSILSKNLNGVASSMGFVLKRQSDKNTPRTRFSKGVQEGKVMAHEMTGVLLVLVLTLRCARGRNFILEEARGKQTDFFPDHRFIDDWVKLLETQLQLEAWLSSDEMKVEHVERSKVKLREYMNLNKRVGKRTKGMGFNTMNFHGTIHIPDQILDFGTPENVNTRCNEMHHKADKRTAMRTNKQPGMFEFQIATKIQHRLAVELAIQEAHFGRPRWHYFNGFDHSERADNAPNVAPFDPILTGAKVKFWKDKETGEWVQKLYSNMKGKENFQCDEITLRAIHELCAYLEDHMDVVWIHTELKVHDLSADNNRVIYHASPYIEGHPWNDFAMFDLTSIPRRQKQDWNPAEMKAFVDLRELPDLAVTELKQEKGIFALIEPTVENLDANEQGLSELFTPWLKEETNLDGLTALFNKMEMVNVNMIGAPAIVIPDLSNDNPRAYLRMAPRSQWASMFEEWLEEDHTREFGRKQTR